MSDASISADLMYRLKAASVFIKKVPPLRSIEVGQDTVEELLSRGVTLIGPFGSGNRILLTEDYRADRVAINFGGSSNCCILVTPGLHHEFSLSVEANHCVCAIFGGWLKFSARLRDERCALFIGEDVAIGGADICVEGFNLQVSIGNESLLAWNITVRTGDSHAIIDRKSGRVINKEKSVYVGERVWIGYGVNLAKGSVVGAGSIVGSNSTVLGEIPRRCLVVGSPAIVKKEDVIWIRSRHPSEEEIMTALHIDDARLG